MATPFLPNFFILGAAKCGTTTLWAYLRDMPDICMSRPKEPLFFEAQFEHGLGFYQQEYFSHWRGEPVIGEARHRNLYLPFVPRRVHAVNPKAKLVAILRNPVERAHSHWYHFYSRGQETMGFNESIQADVDRLARGFPRDDEEDIGRYVAGVLKWRNKSPGVYKSYLDTGYYHEQIARYLALFSRDQLKVLLFEDMVERPREVVGEVVRFLGLDENVNKVDEALWLNVSLAEGEKPPISVRRPPKIVRKALRAVGLGRFVPKPPPTKAEGMASGRPTMDPKTRQWLREHYRPHTERLAEFLGRDLSHWV